MTRTARPPRREPPDEVAGSRWTLSGHTSFGMASEVITPRIPSAAMRSHRVGASGASRAGGHGGQGASGPPGRKTPMSRLMTAR